MSDIEDRIREYLSVGGLFNPELMPADKVRDIVICCRTEIESLRSRLAAAGALLRDCREEIDAPTWSRIIAGFTEERSEFLARIDAHLAREDA